MLAIMDKDFNDRRFNELIQATKKEVITAIVTPFGLGRLLARWDKHGGNVDTVHNVRQGVYATEEQRQKYVNRGDYDSHEYHTDKRYIETNRQHTAQQDDDSLTDAYSNDTLDNRAKRNLDHVISAREIHDDPARVLANKSGSELANKDSNLKSTHESVNKSKKAKSMDEFLGGLDKTSLKRKERIHQLSEKSDLTAQEQQELKKLQQLDNIDHNKARKADSEARQAYEQDIKQYYRSKEFAGNVAKMSMVEGAKMGVQQALGLLLYEFFDATFDELEDIYKHGFSHNCTDSHFVAVLKERLSRIAMRISARWKDIGSDFADGFVAGFLSNIVTVVTNMFITTGKRMVRIIREGFFSLLRAIKILCFPPEGMTTAQAAHAASKLIATGLVTIAGIALEQYVDAMVKSLPILGEFADILVSILIGGLTGLAVTFVVYAIDKIDFFGVNDKEKHRFVMQQLESNLSSMFVTADILIADMSL